MKLGDYALKVPRAPKEALRGYTILTAKRTSAVFLQSDASAFRARFRKMTGDLLDGLDWSNMFTAGGLVLGALLTLDIPEDQADFNEVNKESEWQSSDIDLYIYDLPPDKANEKIKHIANVYQKNLPSGSPFLVVRNSQTITLYSEWPRRRVQIVLKLVRSPRDVLLNFDLDICAVGYNGQEVYMLPRFVRAIESKLQV